MRDLRICLWGLGRVGQALLRLVARNQDSLKTKYGLALRIAGVADQRDAVTITDSENVNAILELKKRTGRIVVRESQVFASHKWRAWLQASRAQLFIDTSVSNFETGQPALDLYHAALQQRMHILTANKAPLLHGLKELQAAAKKNGVQMRYGATVGASLPAWDLLHVLSRESPLTLLEAVLNGTSNWILTEMEEKGASYLSALKEAQYLGYAEPDPNRDVAGLDTAAKLLILANSFLGGIFDWTGITIQGIDRLADGELRQASERKSTIKLLGKAKIDDTGEWHLSVAPEWIPVGHPLARLKGTQKGIYVETSAGGCYALLGGASGAEPTATSMFRELQEILTI